MLLRYRQALGINADASETYGHDGTLFESLREMAPRAMTLKQARTAYAT